MSRWEKVRAEFKARSAPSFKGLRPASETSSRAKMRNRSADTGHERLLRSLLWSRGLRFRKNVKTLPGKPDIVFSRERVAVFCDGDFWHGRNWRKLSRKLRVGANGAYWLHKISTNVRRDRRNSKVLERENWHVIRMWETDIHANPERAVRRVEEIVRARQQILTTSI